MLRTIALWERSLKVVIPLGILCLGHWGLLWHGMFIITSQWIPAAGGCVVVKTSHVFLDINFFYTMAFDLVVLLLTVVALSRQGSRSGLWVMLFRDGLVYFLVAGACNCIPAILNVLNLNIEMDVIATVPAATISSIAACRAVIRLQDYANADSYVHTSSVVGNDVRLTRYVVSTRKPSRYTMTRPEIHVTTDHIITQDISPTTAVTGTPYTPYDGAPFDGTNGELKESKASLDIASSSLSSSGIELRFGKDDVGHVSYAV